MLFEKYKRLALVTTTSLILALILFAPVGAATFDCGAYGAGGYGEGQNCTQPTDPANPTTPPTNPGSSAPPTSTPTSPTDTPAGAGTTIPPSSPANPVKQASPDKPSRLLPLLPLIILLILAMLYLRQSWLQNQANKLSKELIRRMKATRSSTDTYLNITSHYLNTPLSILGNSLELATFLHELSERTTTELKQKISHLTLSIRAITTQYQALATQEEASTQPELTPAKKNHLSRDFLTPTIVALGLVAVFVILYTGVFNIEFSLVNIIFWSLVCAAAVGLAGFAFYTRSRLKNIHTKLKNEQSYEDAMMQQRLQFIGDTYKALSAELKAIRLSASVISDTEHVRPFFNGLAMLEKLTSSLQMASGFISPQSSQHMNISFVTKDLLERWITYAAQEQLSVSYTIQPELTVLANTDDITQLVNATIDNAIRFSSRGSTIFFELKKVAKRAVFVIHNDGNAILAERLQQLFEPFSRATDTIQYDQEGIGLSLYINKIIVDRLGGKIDIMSAPDKGTTVIISLPLARKRRNAPGARVITPQASVPLGTVQ